MINVIIGLLAGLASQPTGTSAQPLVIQIPTPFAAPLPPLPQGAHPATRATANLPALFSKDDYPAAALRSGQSGTVSFSVAIDPTGRVTACTITFSSGSASLDVTTCSIIQRRARFTPARDAEGRAVEDRTGGRIRWVLPVRSLIPFADQRMAVVLSIDAAGTVTGCRVEGVVKQWENDRLCTSLMPRATAIASEAGKRIAITNRELVLDQGLMVGGPDAARNVGRGPGETLGKLVALALDVDAAGTVSGCAAAGEVMDRQRVDEGCNDSLKGKFAPLDPAAGDQSERHAVRYWATYTRPNR